MLDKLAKSLLTGDKVRAEITKIVRYYENKYKASGEISAMIFPDASSDTVTLHVYQQKAHLEEITDETLTKILQE
tara:strand:- start:518 stop:742 length:225 start_codon:yes stop_codon:yes gene_type:complete